VGLTPPAAGDRPRCEGIHEEAALALVNVIHLLCWSNLLRSVK
jgi:hypothetical protein